MKRNNNTLDTYGNVIKGKTKEETVKIIFIIKLNLTDFVFSVGAPPI